MKIKRHVVGIREADCGIAAVAIASGVNYEIVAEEAQLNQLYHHKRGIKPYQLKELLNRVTKFRWQLKYFAIYNMPKLIDLAIKEDTHLIYMVCSHKLLWPGHYIAYQNGIVYDPSEPDGISIFQYKRAHTRVFAGFRVDERFTRK
jgi:hypothetical protein